MYIFEHLRLELVTIFENMGPNLPVPNLLCQMGIIILAYF